MIKINEEYVDIGRVVDFLYKKNYTNAGKPLDFDRVLPIYKEIEVGKRWEEFINKNYPSIKGYYGGIWLAHKVEFHEEHFFTQVTFYSSDLDLLFDEDFYPILIKQLRVVGKSLVRLGLKLHSLSSSKEDFILVNSESVSDPNAMYTVANIEKYVYNIAKALPSYATRADQVLRPPVTRQKGRM